MPTLVNPFDERSSERREPAPRLRSLKGKTIALLDISKPGGSVLLDRLQHLLEERYGVASVVRRTKHTYTKPAPEAFLGSLSFADGVIEALAD